VTITQPLATVPHEGRIGLPTASALYIAAVLGTGVLVLPGAGYAAAGPASILAIAIVLVANIPLAGTFAALAGRYPDGGGVATYVRLALGATAARASGYWFLFGVGFGAPVVATLGGEYLTAAFGLDRGAVPIIGLAFLVIAFGLALTGLKVSGAVQLLLSAVLVGIVVFVIATAAPAMQPGRWEPFMPNGWEGVALAVSLFVWAFAGGEAITHIAHEFRNPRRTIVWATVIALAVVGAAYLGLQWVTIGVPTADGASAVPLIDLVSVTMPAAGPMIVGGIATLVVFGVLNAYMPAFANLTASLARDGHLPRWFSKGSEAGQVPRRALLLVAVVILGYSAVFFGLRLELETYILIHTSAMVAIYAIGMVAAVVLLERFTLGWWLAVVSVVLTTGLLVLAGAHLAIVAALAIVAVSVTVIRKIRARG
jgi:amino acid efflux transporter